MPTPIESTVQKLFENQGKYQVPFYQRSYKWDIDKQIIPLFESFKEHAIQYYNNGNSNPSDAPLYLGTIVLDSGDSASRTHIAGNYRIVDGQQRLVTLSILLAALNDFVQSDDFLYDKSSLNISELMLTQDGKESISKITCSTHDAPIFDIIVDPSKTYNSYQLKKQGLRAHYKKGNIELSDDAHRMVFAYDYYYNQICDFYKSRPSESTRINCISNLFNSVISSDIIVLLLKKQDDAKIVYKSLNSGQPLKAFELIKNDIFIRAGTNEESERLHNNEWSFFENEFISNKEGTSFWDKEETYGKRTLPNSEAFLFYYLLAMRAVEGINVDKLVTEYNKFIDPFKKDHKFNDIKEEVTVMREYAKVFREIVELKLDTDAVKFISTLKNLDVGTQVYPFTMRLVRSEISEVEKKSFYKTFLCYVVRRVVCGISNQGINSILLDMINYLDSDGWTHQNFLKKLLTKEGETKEFPDDNKFRNEWINGNAYSLKAKALFILKEIELHLSRHGEREGTNFKKDISIEHFMPQNWLERWEIAIQGNLRNVSTEEYEQAKTYSIEDDSTPGMIRRRDRLVNNFGNLTILKKGTNSKNSNLGLKDKQAIMGEYSNLKLNEKLNKVVSWDDSDILKRSEELFKSAIEIWPYPFK